MNRRALLQSMAVAPVLAGCSPFVRPRTTRLRLDMFARIAGIDHRTHTVFEVRWIKNLIVLPEMGEWDWKRTGDALMLNLGSKGVLFGIWEQALGMYKNTFRAESRQLLQLLPQCPCVPNEEYKNGALFDKLTAST